MDRHPTRIGNKPNFEESVWQTACSCFAQKLRRLAHNPKIQPSKECSARNCEFIEHDFDQTEHDKLT